MAITPITVLDEQGMKTLVNELLGLVEGKYVRKGYLLQALLQNFDENSFHINYDDGCLYYSYNEDELAYGFDIKDDGCLYFAYMKPDEETE